MLNATDNDYLNNMFKWIDTLNYNSEWFIYQYWQYVFKSATEKGFDTSNSTFTDMNYDEMTRISTRDYHEKMKHNLKIIANFAGVDFLLECLVKFSYTYANSISLGRIKETSTEFNAKIRQVINKHLDDTARNIFNQMRTNQYISYKNDQLAEVFANRFFETNAHNMMINLEAINEIYEKYYNIIPKELAFNFVMLGKIGDFIELHDTLPVDTMESFYNSLKSRGDLTYCLYECLSWAKELTAKQIANCLTNVATMPKSKISNENVDIYCADNIPFNLLICTTAINRHENLDMDYILSRLDRSKKSCNDVISTSLVSNDSMITYRDLKNYVTFCYFDVDPKDIVQVNKADNYTLYSRSDDMVSNYAFDYLTPEEILNHSKKYYSYNEINAHLPAKSNDSHFCLNTSPEWEQSSFSKPQGILSYGRTPTELEIKIAKYYNIPIIQYSSENYKWYGTPFETDLKRFN